MFAGIPRSLHLTLSHVGCFQDISDLRTLPSYRSVHRREPYIRHANDEVLFSTTARQLSKSDPCRNNFVKVPRHRSEIAQ